VSALGGNRGAARTTEVRLGDIDPDAVRSVSEGERHLAGRVELPALDLHPGPFDPHELLSAAGAAWGVVSSGMIDRRIYVAGQVALHIVGPGAIIAAHSTSSPALITHSQWTVAVPVRLVLLGNRYQQAAARWPQLQLHILSRFAEQNEQLAAQLALCQMPRVEDRLLTMLWLLAEQWGKVTSAGTLLPVRITHEALGAMVGARRPTVTLALSELAHSAAVLQRPSGWLLLKPPPAHSGEAPRVEPPQLLDLQPTAWARERTTMEDVHQRHRELLSLISRLRQEHANRVRQLGERLRRSQAIRARAHELREHARDERLPRARYGATNGEQ
jgi:CRP/FNR family cyclic AMP-dependent transcriptional regulator